MAKHSRAVMREEVKNTMNTMLLLMHGFHLIELQNICLASP